MTYPQGGTAVLSVQWRLYPGGPAVDVTGLQITITPLGGGAPTVGPTSVGVVHQATGLYAYSWGVPEGQAVGDYTVLWTATDSENDAVQASETIAVTAATVPGSAGPCDWDIDPDALGLCSDWSTYSEAVQSSAIHLSTMFLWAATGRRYGVCPITVRPSQTRYEDPAYRSYPVWPGQDPAVSGPYLFAGTWRNCGCGAGCCCGPTCAIVLRGPVASVTEVLVDGVEVPSSAYRVDVTGGAYYLVRLDGTCWPTCQNFQSAQDAAGAFVVTYEIGLPLPPVLEVAAGMLACEYAKGLTGGACKLPAKMTRLSRQGVEVEVEPPSPEDGRTGIREVDDVVAMLNPNRRQRPPVLLSPDLPESCDRMTVVHPGAA